MWVVLRVKRRHLIETLGFPDALIDRILKDPVVVKKYVLARLKVWHRPLDSDKVFEEYQELIKFVKPKSVDVKLKMNVHGKVFFERVIVGDVLKKIGQKKSRKWLEDLTTGITVVPTDISPILEDFLA